MATSAQNTISFPRGNVNSLTCVISDVFLGVCTLRYGIILHKCSWICLFHLTSCLGELCILRLTSLPHFFWSHKLDFFFWYYFKLMEKLGDSTRKTHLPFYPCSPIVCVLPHWLSAPSAPRLCVFIPARTCVHRHCCYPASFEVARLLLWTRANARATTDLRFRW